MSSEETLAPTTLPSEPIHINDLCRNGMHKRTMREQDRRMFIEYLFDQVKTLGALSKKQMAKKISDSFKEAHPELKLNEVWVYRLFLAGIYKDTEGKYGYDNVKCDFDESCKHPSLLDKALRNTNE